MASVMENCIYKTVDLNAYGNTLERQKTKYLSIAL